MFIKVKSINKRFSKIIISIGPLLLKNSHRIKVTVFSIQPIRSIRGFHEIHVSIFIANDFCNLSIVAINYIIGFLPCVFPALDHLLLCVWETLHERFVFFLHESDNLLIRLFKRSRNNFV